MECAVGDEKKNTYFLSSRTMHALICQEYASNRRCLHLGRPYWPVAVFEWKHQVNSWHFLYNRRSGGGIEFQSWCLVSLIMARHEMRPGNDLIKDDRLFLYFVSSKERPWRHWAHPRIHAARCMLYASIPVFLFECGGKTHKLHV